MSTYEPTPIEVMHKARRDRLAELTGLPIRYNRLTGPSIDSETVEALADLIEGWRETVAVLTDLADGMADAIEAHVVIGGDCTDAAERYRAARKAAQPTD